jgi:hypothetical protein
MPILSSFGTLRRPSTQALQQGYSANFNNASRCSFSTGSLDPGSNSFSIEFFINMNDTPPTASEDIVVDFGYSSTGGARVSVTDLMAVKAQFRNSTTIVTLTGGVLTVGSWYYVGISRVGTVTKLFINSTEVDSDTVSFSLGFPSNRFGSGINFLTTNFLNAKVASFRYNLGSGFSTATVPTAPLTVTAQTKILTFQTSTLINEVGGAAPSTNTGVTVSQTGPF